MDNLNELVVSANSTVTVFVPLELLRTGRYEISFTLSEYADHHLSSQVDQVIKEIYAMVSIKYIKYIVIYCYINLIYVLGV